MIAFHADRDQAPSSGRTRGRLDRKRGSWAKVFGPLLCVVAKSITARGGNICLPHGESDGQSSQYAADVRGTANADSIDMLRIRQKLRAWSGSDWRFRKGSDQASGLLDWLLNSRASPALSTP